MESHRAGAACTGGSVRGVGAERARLAREVGLAPAMGVIQQPLLSSSFPQAPSSRAGQPRHHRRSFVDADDLFSGLPARESASSQKNLLCAEGSEMVETFWMSELLRGCTGCDAHVVTATLPCLSVRWHFARCWSPCWLVAVESLGAGRASCGANLGGRCSSRAWVGAAGAGGGIRVSPAGVSRLCPVSVPKPRHGDVMDSNSVPAQMLALGAQACFVWGFLVTPSLEPGVSQALRSSSLLAPAPNSHLGSCLQPSLSDPSGSEKLLCGAMKGGGGGGGGRRGCPREGMLFSSSLLFLGLLMS